ncbi:MAG: cyclic nucleotide-binding domain-containing protein [Kiritimatiellaeota bacterium]|nr:cyclic nucleotide-binding domain-containing protein [Kiritimatiellota bacterium]
MDEKHELREALRSSVCFRNLEETALRELVDGMAPATFETGDLLCVEGEPGDRMFLIAGGQVSVRKAAEGGRSVEVAVLRSGDIAGEMSLLGAATRTATLQARTPVRAWVLDRAGFDHLLSESPDVCRGLLRQMTDHLSRGTSLLARLLSQDGDPRFHVAFFDTKPYMEEAFEEHLPSDVAIRYYRDRLTSETVSLAAGAHAVCVFVNDVLDKTVLGELATLDVRMVALRCAGYNNVDLKAARRLGISVARVPAYSPYAVAEHAVGLMLGLNRKLHKAYQRVREGNFSLNGLTGFDMHGRTAGVIGAGKIGTCVLRILAGFGCRLLAFDLKPDEALASEIGVKFTSVDEVLAESEIISLHAPLCKSTFHLIDAAAIRRMKPGVLLINTSRGALIDTRALIAGLKSGRIGAAGLDVYEEESGVFFEDLSGAILTDDVLARLMTFPNVLITSHQGFLTRDALEGIAAVTFENLRQYRSGKRFGELSNAVLPPE